MSGSKRRDLVIIGAGPAGLAAARAAAYGSLTNVGTEPQLDVLVLEARSHIGESAPACR